MRLVAKDPAEIDNDISKEEGQARGGGGGRWRPLLSRGDTKRHYRGPPSIDEGRSCHHHVSGIIVGGFRLEGGA